MSVEYLNCFVLDYSSPPFLPPSLPPSFSSFAQVPNIFIAGKPVGGFTDGIEQLHQEGRLVPLLKEAGAL